MIQNQSTKIQMTYPKRILGNQSIYHSNKRITKVIDNLTKEVDLYTKSYKTFLRKLKITRVKKDIPYSYIERLIVVSLHTNQSDL
jgi:hypothetical protein